MAEVEAKFTIPDRATFDRLCWLEELAGYVLQPAGVKRIQDRYLDTADRAILKAGYACRLRRKVVAANTEEGNRFLATLKGLGGADATSGIHQREELEVWVDGPNPSNWPESHARDVVISLSDGKRLHELFSLHQERHLRFLHRACTSDSAPLAELSLDQVASGGDEGKTYYELEIELVGENDIVGLELIAVHLRSSWGLEPELRSKFERGLGHQVA